MLNRRSLLKTLAALPFVKLLKAKNGTEIKHKKAKQKKGTFSQTKIPDTLTHISNSMHALVLYRIDDYGKIYKLVGKSKLITITFEDGSTVFFYGYLAEIVPEEIYEGVKVSCAQIIIIPTNYDEKYNEIMPELSTVEESPWPIRRKPIIKIGNVEFILCEKNS